MDEGADACPRADRIHAIHRLEDGLLALALGGMILVCVAQIALRNLFDAGWPWADPFLRMLVLWVGLQGALVAGRRDQHIAIDVVTRMLPVFARRWVHAVVGLFTAGVCGMVAWHGGRFAMMDLEAHVPGVVGLPAWVFEGMIPVAFGVLALRYLGHAWAAVACRAPAEERRHWR